MNQQIWITWEHQRRSIEMAKALDIPCYVLTFHGPYILRSIVLVVKTLLLLVEVRPTVVFVQNPSMIAAAVVCGLRSVLGYKVVVDRHSNFKLATIKSDHWKHKGFQLLSRYTIKAADLTVVTNTYLSGIVESWGGRGVVLQDKLPDFSGARIKKLKGRCNGVFICSYAADEPVWEVVEAARLIDSDICIYVTGNYKKANESLLREAPDNVVLTGFLPESDFQALVRSADFALALTSEDHTLLCGAYEAVAAHKPLIISDREALKTYFSEGAVVAENDRNSIANAITFVVRNMEVLRKDVVGLEKRLRVDWDARFQDFRRMVV